MMLVFGEHVSGPGCYYEDAICRETLLHVLLDHTLRLYIVTSSSH